MRAKAIYILVGITLTATAIYTMFAPRHWEFEARNALMITKQNYPAAVAKWQALNIRDYDVQAMMFFPPGCIMSRPATFHVRDGVLTKVEWPDDVPAQVVEAFYEQRCPAKDVKPDIGLLNLGKILPQIDSSEQYLYAEFDATFGFIRNYVFDLNSNGVGDSASHYTLSNFTPLAKDSRP